jgi:hypothetical protein
VYGAVTEDGQRWKEREGERESVFLKYNREIVADLFDVRIRD